AHALEQEEELRGQRVLSRRMVEPREERVLRRHFQHRLALQRPGQAAGQRGLAHADRSLDDDIAGRLPLAVCFDRYHVGYMSAPKWPPVAGGGAIVPPDDRVYGRPYTRPLFRGGGPARHPPCRSQRRRGADWMYYAILGTDTPDSLEKRLSVR